MKKNKIWTWQGNIININLQKNLRVAKCIFTLNTHGIVLRLDHILHPDILLNAFYRTELIQSIYFTQNGMKLEVNNKRVFDKITSIWKLNDSVSHKQLIKL